jgi:hypothetical protein
MTDLNHPATLRRAQDQINKIAAAETSTVLDLRNTWARGYIEALLAEELIDWAEYCRLNDAVDHERDQCMAGFRATHGK